VCLVSVSYQPCSLLVTTQISHPDMVFLSYYSTTSCQLD
jgi:hypothetical protein